VIVPASSRRLRRRSRRLRLDLDPQGVHACYARSSATPGEAASLSTLVSNVAKAVEKVEIVARLKEQMAVKGNNQ
jgi:hypothetical protein